MKTIRLLTTTITLLVSLSAHAQFIEFAMGYTREEVEYEFKSGGLFEGMRYATTNEAWLIIENAYGFDRFATEEENARPTYDLIQDMGTPFVSGGTYINMVTFAHVQDGPQFGMYFALAQYSDLPEALGRIEQLDFTVQPDHYVGHFLVSDDYIVPVPESATAVLFMVPALLGSILLARRRTALPKQFEFSPGQSPNSN